MPLHPFSNGIAVIVAIKGFPVIFTDDRKLAIFPVPDAGKPIAMFEFDHVIDAPEGDDVNSMFSIVN